MSAKEQYVQVQNLTDNPVVYLIPEDNLRRVFGPYEEKKISVDELQKLYYQPGGSVLVQEFLRIKDRELAQEFGVDDESYDNEYSWDRAKVDNVLMNEHIDVLHDALDFAPEGIIDLITERAVALRIADVNKRNLIYECTGKDINSMIAVQIQLEQELGDKKEEAPKRRRAQKTEEVKTEQPKQRRASSSSEGESLFA